jgi:hypothetical protein
MLTDRRRDQTNLIGFQKGCGRVYDSAIPEGDNIIRFKESVRIVKFLCKNMNEFCRIK